jgi:hypothetical protein
VIAAGECTEAPDRSQKNSTGKQKKSKIILKTLGYREYEKSKKK